MEVFQIIGSILLLIIGVAVIVYVLFRKSPVKTETQDADPDGELPDGEIEEISEDDAPEEAPKEPEPEEKK